MKRAPLILGIGLLAAAVVVARELVNGSFEQPFGSRETQNMWGEYGETFGEAHQVKTTGGASRIPLARSGSRILLINVPPTSWNGAWQQIAWPEQTPFAWEAYYLIRDGDLPEGCATFMKVEFFNEADQLIEAVEGTRRRKDTRGRWERDVIKGVTPIGTAAIRFVLIAGENAGETTLVNRIFWDDAKIID